MSENMQKSIEALKNKFTQLVKGAPFLLQKNEAFQASTELISDLIKIIECQANQIEALKEEQYSRGE